VSEIIQFILQPGRDDAQTDFPTIVFRFAVQDGTVAHIGSEPGQHTGPASRET
jgi:hypothetical protein